ncbi:phage virion morphogenesis protein [Halarcobacter sp.]|uniref:phage virion morphogenesis protein n=1 Tax=Halarcobacter sp. TaxID=2321133 RepID=UPI0029F59150|nr:phage virion morphogenesis protein [Halarcobacter sp.]
MQINTTGLDDLQAKLINIQEKIENTQPLMGELSNHLENIVLNSFEKQMSPDGKPWSPIKARKTDPHPEKILYSSGNLQGSLYSKATKDSAIVGLNAVSNSFQYPLTHQFGTDKAGRNKKVTIVARPFMPVDAEGKVYAGVEDELLELVEDYIEEFLI